MRLGWPLLATPQIPLLALGVAAVSVAVLVPLTPNAVR